MAILCCLSFLSSHLLWQSPHSSSWHPHPFSSLSTFHLLFLEGPETLPSPSQLPLPLSTLALDVSVLDRKCNPLINCNIKKNQGIKAWEWWGVREGGVSNVNLKLSLRMEMAVMWAGRK